MLQKTNFFQNLKLVFDEGKFLYLGDNSLIRGIKRLLLTLWCLPFLQRASLWLTAMGNPLLAREFLRTPRIRQFLYRKYVNRHWRAAQRMEAIEEHYNLVRTTAPLLNLAPDEYIDLVKLDVLQNNLRVVMDRPHWMNREGEMGVSLFLGTERVYTAMFLLRGTPADMKLIIGCVQGKSLDTGSNLYKELTKELHGMRPRDFLLNLVTIISEKLGCREILGISDKAHFSKHWYSRAFKHAAYDTIWEEHGGVRTDDRQFFSLPTKIIKRADAEITAKKRALYRRRYLFLDDLKVYLRRAILSHPQKKQHQRAVPQ